ncbi:alpha/beta hydrolase [Frigidibacter sp. ROC022]|uniref:alpha/beta hydrolase n=1 Tax=Frigidibacter sp. ROC022 TaxID=2971796 RepID=UPI00215A1F04|nr:alpha/beta hydrolase [Frigidibacter sp. ROC022]MCR8724636.1 alpha/beta hydrolase [Frigidibacter sp. ROC022]
MASREIEAALAQKHAESEKIAKQTQSLAEMRAKLDAGVRDQVLDPSVGLETVDAGGVPAVWLTPPEVTTDIVWLFFHGGAYVKGNVAASHGALSGLCRASGARALSVDYRVAPEHPYPAALDDARMAWAYLLQQGHPPGRIVVSGSSAGGGLALALAIACRDAGGPQPGALVPISPWADLTQSGESMQTRADRDPELTKPYLDRFAADYAGRTDPRLPTISPVFADWRGVTSAMLVQVGSEEILFDDARRVVEAATKAGLTAQLDIYDKAWHGWQNLGAALPEAVDAARNAAAFLRRHLDGE